MCCEWKEFVATISKPTQAHTHYVLWNYFRFGRVLYTIWCLSFNRKLTFIEASLHRWGYLKQKQKKTENENGSSFIFIVIFCFFFFSSFNVYNKIDCFCILRIKWCDSAICVLLFDLITLFILILILPVCYSPMLTVSSVFFFF